MALWPGTQTPWREWDGDLGPQAPLVFVRDGNRPGLMSSLAEALRNDGIAQSLGMAYRMAAQVSFLNAFYGYVEDEREPVVCNEEGETVRGDQVKQALPCVFALIEGTS